MPFRKQIREHEDNALRAQTTTSEVLTDNPDAATWDAPTSDKYKNALTDFAENHQKAQDLKAQQAKHEEMQRQADKYKEPSTASSFAVRKPETAAGTDPEALVPTPVKTKSGVTWKESLARFIRGGGPQALSREEQQTFLRRQGGGQFALSSEVDSLGGFLVPEDVRDDLISLITRTSVMRPISRVATTDTNNACFLTLTPGDNPYRSGISGAWKRENYVTGGTAPPTQDQPRWGHERIPISNWEPDAFEIPRDLIEDARRDIVSDIMELLAEVRATDEDSAFTTGPGDGLPQGFTNGGISTVTAGGADSDTDPATNFGYVDLINLRQNLPSQYRRRPNTRWLMNSLTYGHVLGLRDSNNLPIFTPNQLFDQLFGTQIVFNEWLDDVGSGNEPIYFGDFSYYAIADRMDLQITILREKYAPNTGLLAYARLGGQLLMAQPFRALTFT